MRMFGQTRKTIATSFVPTPARAGVLQRRCACGGTPGPTGECAKCRGKRRPTGTLQPKLEIGQPGDRYEREADGVADQVMGTTRPDVRRRIRQYGGEAILQGAAPGQGLIRASEGGEDAPAIVHEVLSSSGRPLDSSTRHIMESRFGHDFSHVHIHTGSKADASARMLGARAYTAGKDVVFGNGQYNPNAHAGRWLLAHELAHTIQQRSSARGGYKIQCDLAVTPQGSGRERGLSAIDISRAIAFNRRMFTDPYSLRTIRDVVGVPKYPAVSDEALVLGVARWQADHGIAQDGRVGVITLMFILEELQAEGQDRDAQLLRADFRGRRGRIPDISTSHCGCRSALQDEISDSQAFIPVYQQCGADPAVTSGEQVESCVDQHFARQGVTLTTLGTTSSSGAVAVARRPGPCGPLLEQVTRAHEQIHRVHTEELRQRHGSGSAFRRAFNDASDWVADEVNARRTDIASARFMLEVLNGICVVPASGSP